MRRQRYSGSEPAIAREHSPTPWYLDGDGDGLGDPATSVAACSQPAGYVANASDGDPSCATTKDVCGVCGGNGVPVGACNCAGTAPAQWYLDADGDGLGDPATSVASCSQPAGYVANANDTDPSCATTKDVCGVCGGSGIPAGNCDCAGHVLDACNVCGGGGIPVGACSCGGAGPTLWYGDADGDGKGDPAVSTSACARPQGYVNNATDNDPTCATARDACGTCAGTATTCPLLGNYAVRSAVFAKGKSGEQVNGSKAISFALMTITANGDGTLRVVEQGCYAETQPITGTTAYSWSKPAWSQAVPAATRTLTRNADGSWQREDTAQPLGWSPGRRPSSCSDTNPGGSATPLSPWPSGSGTTCTCNLSTNTLPPFDKSAPYDCRLLDVDQDGYPGVSAFASTEAPATSSSDAGGFSWARIMLASNPASTWTITPASNGAHSATLFDRGQSSVVGCVGGGIINACGLVTTNPVSTTCPSSTTGRSSRPLPRATPAARWWPTATVCS